jgi:hypothetical protein
MIRNFEENTDSVLRSFEGHVKPDHRICLLRLSGSCLSISVRTDSNSLIQPLGLQDVSGKA